jgi:hypothetical protein
VEEERKRTDKRKRKIDQRKEKRNKKKVGEVSNSEFFWGNKNKRQLKELDPKELYL